MAFLHGYSCPKVRDIVGTGCIKTLRQTTTPMAPQHSRTTELYYYGNITSTISLANHIQPLLQLRPSHSHILAFTNHLTVESIPRHASILTSKDHCLPYPTKRLPKPARSLAHRSNSPGSCVYSFLTMLASENLDMRNMQWGISSPRLSSGLHPVASQNLSPVFRRPLPPLATPTGCLLLSTRVVVADGSFFRPLDPRLASPTCSFTNPALLGL